MRYNFDIKNSLFEYWIFFSLCACFHALYAKYSPTACLLCLSTLQSHFVRGFKRLSFFHSGDKENLIWNKSRNTFFIADNSNAFLFFFGCILLFPSAISSAVCNVLIEKNASDLKITLLWGKRDVKEASQVIRIFRISFSYCLNLWPIHDLNTWIYLSVKLSRSLNFFYNTTSYDDCDLIVNAKQNLFGLNTVLRFFFVFLLFFHLLMACGIYQCSWLWKLS